MNVSELWVDAVSHGNLVSLLLLFTGKRKKVWENNVKYALVFIKLLFRRSKIQIDICYHLALTFEDSQRTRINTQAVEVCKLADMRRVCFLLYKRVLSWSDAASECI